MINIAVVYFSGYGHTEKQAQAIQEGAASVPNVEVTSYSVNELVDDASILNSADAIIFGSPTYMGSVAADFKKFMDNTSRIWVNQLWKNKIAAGFTNSKSMSGDKLNVLVQLAIFAAQHSMIWVGLSEMDQSPPNQTGDPNSINRIGSFLGAMAQSENAPAEVTPPTGDLDTAFSLGKRVATMTKQFCL